MAGEMMAEYETEETVTNKPRDPNDYSKFTNAAIADAVEAVLLTQCTSLARENSARLHRLEQLEQAYRDANPRNDVGYSEEAGSRTWMPEPKRRAMSYDRLSDLPAKQLWKAPMPLDGEPQAMWLIRVVESMEEWVNR